MNEHGWLYIIVLPCKHQISPDYDYITIQSDLYTCITVSKTLGSLACFGKLAKRIKNHFKM